MSRHDRKRAHIPVRCTPAIVDEAVGALDNNHIRNRGDNNADARTVDHDCNERDVTFRAESPLRGPQPNVTISNALSLGLARIGENAGLEPLIWRALDLGGEPLIEGMPGAESPDPLATCLGWAKLLELEEYAWDVGDGMRTWFRVEGEWQIEVSTPRTA